MFPKLRINHASWGYSSGIEWKWPERKLKLEDNELVQIFQTLKYFIEYLTVGKQTLGQTRFLKKHVLLESNDLSSNHWSHMKTRCSACVESYVVRWQRQRSPLEQVWNIQCSSKNERSCLKLGSKVHHWVLSWYPHPCYVNVSISGTVSSGT